MDGIEDATMLRGTSMQPPEPPHMELYAHVVEWSTQIIMGLIAVLLVVLRFIGKSDKADTPYATRDEMIECQHNLIGEFKEMRKELNQKIDNASKRIDDDIGTAHKRIDDLYKR